MLKGMNCHQWDYSKTIYSALERYQHFSSDWNECELKAYFIKTGSMSVGCEAGSW